MIAFVATPIGNLKDITLRALEELRAADVIFCEDTRHTVKLLSAYDIKKPLRACHKFNEHAAAEEMIALHGEGKRICVVSDAGMPVVSDPGNTVCKDLRAAGVPYTVLPGANAALSALVLSALDASRFTFVGFLPDKAGERRRLLERFQNARETLLFHSAPQDVDRDIAAMFEVFGERNACAVREITKLYALPRACGRKAGGICARRRRGERRKPLECALRARARQGVYGRGPHKERGVEKGSGRQGRSKERALPRNARPLRRRRKARLPVRRGVPIWGRALPNT